MYQNQAATSVCTFVMLLFKKLNIDGHASKRKQTSKNHLLYLLKSMSLKQKHKKNIIKPYRLWSQGGLLTLPRGHWPSAAAAGPSWRRPKGNKPSWMPRRRQKVLGVLGEGKWWVFLFFCFLGWLVWVVWLFFFVCLVGCGCGRGCGCCCAWL